MRPFCVRIHRWVGLFLAGFLLLSGLTGSIICFHHELDRWLNPGVLTVQPTGSQRLPAGAWIEAAEAAHPRAQVTYITVPQAADEPAVLYLVPRINPSTDEAYTLAADQVFVHPGTGEVLGSRDRDGFRIDRLHLIPFIYTFHYSLHLGQWGMWIFGGIAIVWFFDCFFGLYLAWPQRTWAAIKRALTVKWRGSSFRINYDLHRAGGLWAWLVLLVLAFSGISLNLHKEVFDPLLESLFPTTPWPGDVAPEREDAAAPLPTPVAEAITAADEGLGESDLEGRLGAIWIDPLKGLYHLGYHTPDDLTVEHPGGWVSVSAADSSVIAVRPAGGEKLGDMIHDWQFPLHSGKAFGLAGRIVICVTGLAVAMLSVTGVVVWWKKRRARQGQAKNNFRFSNF